MLVDPLTSLWTSSLVAASDKASYWDSQSFVSGSTKTYVDPDMVGGSMMTLVFTRTSPATVRDDVMNLSLHWGIEAGPGVPSAPLSGSQAASIESIMTTWWNSMKINVFNTVTLKEFDWRDFKASFPRGESGMLKYSPTWRVTNVATAGTVSTGNELPHQIASTLTMTTGSRKHWGRFYMPGAASGMLGTFGRWGSGYPTNLVDQTRIAFNAAVALPAITNPWVWSAKYSGLLSVREIHADDIPDVQRRRRDKQVAFRHSRTS